MCLPVMCSVVKQQGTSSRTTCFFISLASVSLLLLRSRRELNRVIQVPIFGPSSIDEHSLRKLVKTSSEVELMSCSFNYRSSF